MFQEQKKVVWRLICSFFFQLIWNADKDDCQTLIINCANPCTWSVSSVFYFILFVTLIVQRLRFSKVLFSIKDLLYICKIFVCAIKLNTSGHWNTYIRIFKKIFYEWIDTHHSGTFILSNLPDYAGLYQSIFGVFSYG